MEFEHYLLFIRLFESSYAISRLLQSSESMLCLGLCQWNVVVLDFGWKSKLSTSWRQHFGQCCHERGDFCAIFPKMVSSTSAFITLRVTQTRNCGYGTI